MENIQTGDNMTREEMKHVHTINEQLHAARSPYLLHISKDGIEIGHDQFGMVTGEWSKGSQDARREFDSIKHHGDHHGRHRTLESQERFERREEDDRVETKESLAHIQPFTRGHAAIPLNWGSERDW